MIRVNIAANVSDAAIVANLIESWEHARNQNLKTSRHSCIILQPFACLLEIARFRRDSRVAPFRVAVEDRINNFGEATTAQLRGKPTMLHEVLSDILVLRQKRIAQPGWNRCEGCCCRYH